ncbi:hypothetical protein L204_105176 [Cryptococcus depauperatus]|nr:hypothetical protein L204_03828 [Cryptococcus depauperatus CBS 7855]
MRPTSFPGTTTQAALQSIRQELEGCMFRHVEGFFAKYFEDTSWCVAVENMMRETQSAESVRKLSTDLPRLTHFDALVNWLAACEALLSAGSRGSFCFRSQPLSGPASPLVASIWLGTSDSGVSAGNTRALGEYHQAGAHDEAEHDTDLFHFCDRARQIFTAEPARRFLHGFTLCGTTLELWVFDRSGAYSSGKLDLSQQPGLLLHVLAGYTMMRDEEAGCNTFVKRRASAPDSFVAFGPHTLYLRPTLVAAPRHLVGLGTTCYAASATTTGEPDSVVKFSWRKDRMHAELRLLQLAHRRRVWGVVQLVGHEDLGSVADLRHGLVFPQPFVNRTLSCVATAPLGRPIQTFASISELLAALRDLVRALQSLYMDGRILHRDIAIKNVVITPQPSEGSPTGMLIDFDQALDLDNVRAVEPMVGSDGFMAIGILSGQPHTYRHDLESLFYVFLWMAIGNDHEHDDAYAILQGMPDTSRLWTWCSMDFRSVGQEKAADMSPDGFSHILAEFSVDFAPLRALAQELHRLLFPLRDGHIFTGTETEPTAIKRLYDGMADAFSRNASERKKQERPATCQALQ